MKKYALYISLIVGVAFVSCKKEAINKPKVIYEDTNKSKQEAQIDTSEIEAADLPIIMEGTNYLIHPIGVIFGKSKGLKSYSDSEQSFAVSNAVRSGSTVKIIEIKNYLIRVSRFRIPCAVVRP